MKHVAVIGGGAAGMTAAIAAARNGAVTTLFEHTAKTGKKILSTGNGRCNLTNEYMTADCFHGTHPRFAMEVISRFNRNNTIDFFESIGIYPYKNEDGYYYPGSMQAASVSRALSRELAFLGVNVLFEADIKQIDTSLSGFRIKTREKIYTADSVILACGGQAAPQTGSDGSGYTLARGLGLTVIAPVPALVPLTSSWKGFKELNGIRVRGSIAVYLNEDMLSCSSGELQLCEYGLSGIPVFQVSGPVSRAFANNRNAMIQAELSFTGELTKNELNQWMEKQIILRGNTRCGDFLNGLLPEKLALMLIRLARIPFDLEIRNLNHAQIKALTRICTSLRIPITGTLGFDRAQVTSGGISTEEFSPSDLQSKKYPGLYAAGEILDIDGICGGYNLQFAWSSGYLAGKNAAVS